jgi:hypothetical protein
MSYLNTVDEMLRPYKPVLANDFDKYRNHVCRVYLHCLLLDTNKANATKYAIAAVFHDLGLWTDKTFDYVAPSMAAAANYLSNHHKLQWVEEINGMIYWHHKTTPYAVAFSTTIETFRKADWVDVTLGLTAFGINEQKIRNFSHKLPLLGFHFFLFKKAFQYFLRHPLYPLPMFKW